MPFTTSEPEIMLSLNELARKANISYPTMLKLASNGIIKPDAYSGRTLLFKSSRWEELRRAIRESLYGYGGYVRAQFDRPDHPLCLH